MRHSLLDPLAAFCQSPRAMRRRMFVLVCALSVSVGLFMLAMHHEPWPVDKERPDRESDEDTPFTSNLKYQPLRYSAKLRHQTASSDSRAVNEFRPNDASHRDTETFVRLFPAASDDVTSRKRLTSVPGLSAITRRRHKFARKEGEPAPIWSSLVYYDQSSPPPIFNNWTSSANKLCWSDGSGSRFVMYSGLFAYLRNVVIDPRMCRSDRLGGEEVNDVIGQEETAEYYVVSRGCFRLACSTPNEKKWSAEKYFFQGNSHLNSWLRDGVAIKKWQTNSFEDVGKEIDSFTIAVQRYEYVNLYHTMTDWYNAFVMMQYFRHSAAETVILIVDTHPHGSLDDVWNRLFGTVIRLSGIGRQRPVLFRQLVWSIVGYESPMKIYPSVPTPPLYEEFRHHFLSSYNFDVAKTDSPTSTNCSSLSVLFIWRRNYVAHPRNSAGQVTRKISNERELIEYVQRRRPHFRVRGAQLDVLDMRAQLRLVLDADILVGVHGAGMTHTIFMRPGTGIAEIAPNDVWSGNDHFKAIAGWRQLFYVRWTNRDFMLEDDLKGTVRVPPYVADALVGRVARYICRSSPKKNHQKLKENSNFIPRSKNFDDEKFGNGNSRAENR